MVIEDHQCAQRGGHSFAASEKELDGPYMARDDRDRRQGDPARVRGEVARRPNHEGALAEIAQESEQETHPAQHPADVFCAGIAAAQIADVLASAKANEVIARREATQCICAQGNPACLSPVSRLKLFDPAHAVYVRSSGTNKWYFYFGRQYPESGRRGNKKFLVTARPPPHNSPARCF